MEKAFLAGVQKFFGIKADATEEELKAVFDGIKPLSDSNTIDLEPINTKIQELRTELDELATTVQGIDIQAGARRIKHKRHFN